MPVHNEDVAAIFDELADLLEIEEANPFRVRAYRNAARSVRSLARGLDELVAERRDLTQLQGIGKELAAKIHEILETGTTAALGKLHRRVPATLEDLMRIPGLGPKRVKALYTELGIQNLEQLEAAAKEGRLQALPGFGAKTEHHILEVIATHREVEHRILRAVAAPYAAALVAYLKRAPGVRQVVVAGSYRRGAETIGDLDILVTATRQSPVMARFVAYDEVREIVSQGTTRATVLLRCGLQVDLRVVKEESFGAALHYFTGAKAHNIAIRRLGQQRRLKINEYGVFQGSKRVAGATEASVFEAVGLPFIPPELREDRGEIDAARAGRLPELVEVADLRGDLHSHTTATDGRADLKEMAHAAKRRGRSYLAITDHSRHLTVVHGLDGRRLLQQRREIDRINGAIRGFTLLAGVEVDILEDGRLDLSDEVLGDLDLVVAAVHTHFHLPRTQQTERILRAMDQRCFSILAHPSGRLLGEREPYDVDMARIIDHARQRGCFLELNSQPVRLDLTDTYCRMAREQGVLVAINSDAHDEHDLDNLHLGVNQARRGWLEKDDVLNTRPLPELRRLLRRTMG